MKNESQRYCGRVCKEEMEMAGHVAIYIDWKNPRMETQVDNKNGGRPQKRWWIVGDKNSGRQRVNEISEI